MRKVYVGGLGVLVASLVAAILAASGSTPPTTANLWVDANGGTCTRQASPAAYDDASACATLDAANDACQAGDTALVAAGTYASQTITGYNSRATAQCTIRAQDPDPANTRLRGLKVGNPGGTDGSRYLTLQGFQVIRPSGNQQSSAQIFAGSQHVTYKDIDAANFYVRNTSDTRIEGGDWGPCTTTNNDVNDACSNSKFDSSGSETNTNAVVDGAVFHDYRNNLDQCLPSPGTIDCHFECMFLRGATGITIRNSRFRDCAFFDVFIQSGSQAVSGVVLENNWFDPPWNDQADPPTHGRDTGVMLSNGISNILVRFNSFHPLAGVVDDGSTQTNVRILGNILRASTAVPGATYAYNLSNGTAYSGTANSNIGSTFPYTTTALGSTANFHLSPTATAHGYVTATTSDYGLTTDIDGDARTAGARSAGSDE